MRTVRIDLAFGTFDQAVDQARELAYRETVQSGEDTQVEFEFNELEIRVCNDSPPSLLHRDFMRGMSGYHRDVVGPYPPDTLSAEVIAEDERIEREREERRAAQRVEWERKDRERREAFKREVGEVRLDVVDEDAWKADTEFPDDPDMENEYARAIVRYAESWGRLMQVRLSADETAMVADVAEKASHDSDLEGSTGFMYGLAVNLLAKHWVRGEELRRWHNLKYQIRDEGERANESGGVLNPAIISVGSKDG